MQTIDRIAFPIDFFDAVLRAPISPLSRLALLALARIGPAPATARDVVRVHEPTAPAWMVNEATAILLELARYGLVREHTFDEGYAARFVAEFSVSAWKILR